jgi:hypothetical protein
VSQAFQFPLRYSGNQVDKSLTEPSGRFLFCFREGIDSGIPVVLIGDNFMTASLLTLVFCFFAFFQNEGSRAIIPEEFVKARPAKSKTAAAKRLAYRNATGKTATKSSDKPDNFTQLGLTIWRLRQAVASDSGTRIIVHGESQTTEWMPERMEANTPLRIGERIRFSFESPQTGYLYVINREQYANGTLGDPYLIFPTTRTRKGDNQVTAGRLIEIPAQDDHPNFFTLRQSRMDQTGENVTVIVSRQPLAELTITDKALKLSVEQVAKWEAEWGAQTERFEMVGGKGKAWTSAEQTAGADATRSLTQDDPAPQTIYRVATKPGQPVLIKVGLQYRTARARAKSAK